MNRDTESVVALTPNIRLTTSGLCGPQTTSMSKLAQLYTDTPAFVAPGAAFIVRPLQLLEQRLKD
jgi:hypothetical protein